MASTPPRCPITTISNHAKNLERGQGGVWLNGMLEKLLSRLSVCSGACVPHSFCFIMFLAQASLEWRSVLRGACRRHAQRCGDRGLHHQLASVISCGSLSVHHFLASPAKPACVARRYRLGFLALDDALDPGGVRNPAQRFALQAEVMQVKGAKPLAQPPPEHLHGVQVGAFGRYPPQLLMERSTQQTQTPELTKKCSSTSHTFPRSGAGIVPFPCCPSPPSPSPLPSLSS